MGTYDKGQLGDPFCKGRKSEKKDESASNLITHHLLKSKTGVAYLVSFNSPASVAILAAIYYERCGTIELGKLLHNQSPSSF
jgi:hypothetical protein